MLWDLAALQQTCSKSREGAHPAMEMSKGKVTTAADTTGGMCSRFAFTACTIAASRSSSADCSRAARATRTAGGRSRSRAQLQTLTHET